MRLHVRCVSRVLAGFYARRASLAQRPPRNLRRDATPHWHVRCWSLVLVFFFCNVSVFAAIRLPDRTIDSVRVHRTHSVSFFDVDRADIIGWPDTWAQTVPAVTTHTRP